MIEIIFDFISIIISQVGYFGVFFLMVLESMIFPVPSEAVLPFAGYLSFQGRFDIFFVTFVATVGSIVGSIISYYIGYFGGKPFVIKIGKYFFLDPHHLDATHKFFEKHGSKTVFISRFIPVIRHLISIPAGFAKMNLKKFLVLTFIGAFLWNFFLVWLGFRLFEKYYLVAKYSKPLDYLVLTTLIIALIYYFYKHIKKKSSALKNK